MLATISDRIEGASVFSLVFSSPAKAGCLSRHLDDLALSDIGMGDIKGWGTFVYQSGAVCGILYSQIKYNPRFWMIDRSGVNLKLVRGDRVSPSCGAFESAPVALQLVLKETDLFKSSSSSSASSTWALMLIQASKDGPGGFAPPAIG
jgi:hypothetical protein